MLRGRGQHDFDAFAVSSLFPEDSETLPECQLGSSSGRGGVMKDGDTAVYCQ